MTDYDWFYFYAKHKKNFKSMSVVYKTKGVYKYATEHIAHFQLYKNTFYILKEVYT